MAPFFRTDRSLPCYLVENAFETVVFTYTSCPVAAGAGDENTRGASPPSRAPRPPGAARPLRGHQGQPRQGPGQGGGPAGATVTQVRHREVLSTPADDKHPLCFGRFHTIVFHLIIFKLSEYHYSSGKSSKQKTWTTKNLIRLGRVNSDALSRLTIVNFLWTYRT